MRRFYAPPDAFTENGVTLSVEETRHLRNVLRLKTGDTAQVFDGEGREFLVEIGDVKKSGAEMKIVNEVAPSAPESDLDLTLATAVYKNDKLDLVVQKAVELGVARITPIITFRSEATLRDATKRTERWRKIAMEATKQCERARVMLIDEPLAFEDFLKRVDSSSRALMMFSEKGGGGIPSSIADKKITALVGPKGGWEDSEIESAERTGFVTIKLGSRIMRAETAAITFAALLQHRFGDLG
jgi:16S rRNA (uracil1498-N3)-methyltransferase